jgi:hypothetical protein
VKPPSGAGKLVWHALGANQVLEFAYGRFSSYRSQKADHQSWDEARQELWDLPKVATKETFISEMRAANGGRYLPRLLVLPSKAE